MALLQIAEPGESAAPHQRRLAVGIDLGTTNSLVAAVHSGAAAVLSDSQGRWTVPSVVRYDAHGGVSVGEDAQAADDSESSGVISSAKRLMGKGANDLESTWMGDHFHFDLDTGSLPAFKTPAGSKTAIEVSADILRVLRDTAERSLGGDLAGVVITVPAYFDDAQRQATKDAAALAGLQVLRLINEPTAAAVAYGLDQPAGHADVDRTVAIFDFGGGTFDISLLRLQGGVFEVLATAGDTALGGDDIDSLIVAWMMCTAGINSLSDAAARSRARAAARSLKERLTSADIATLEWQPEAGQLHSLTLSRQEFDALIEPLVERTLGPCRQVLRDAGLTKRDLAAVVMVGGSTRIPLVRARVSSFFGQNVLTDIDPDKVVAIGAAVQADVLAGNRPDSDLLLLDVIPLSLGIETMGGLVEKIIPRNTTIPIARAQEFTTYKDGQSAIALHVVQGERELVSDCRSLARFELRGIPPKVAGAVRIQVLFQVDADGLLTVSALEKDSGVLASVDVKPSYGLAEAEIAAMLRASLQHAEDDMSQRRLAEARVDAARTLEALDSALTADGAVHLDSDERAALEELMQTLRRVMEQEDPALIRQSMRAVEDGSAAFVQRRMDASVRQLMAGRELADLEQRLQEPTTAADQPE